MIDWDLLVKYFAGECSAEEVNEIEAWMKKDPLRKKDIEQLRSIWKASDRVQLNREQLDKINLEDEWLLMQAKMHSFKSEAKPAANKTAGAKSGKAQRIYKTPVWQFARVAAVLLVMISGGYMVSQFMTPDSTEVSEVRFSEISTERGQRAGVQLKDGSKVNLSVESTIRHAFSDEVREVHMEGEAYFDVFRDPSRPFIIQSSHALIKVLGTDFTVKAYPTEDYVQVAVLSGSVSVESLVNSERQNVVITTGEIAYLDINTGELTIKQGDPQKYMNWMQGHLVFENATISEVGRELERWFDVEFEIANEDITGKRLTAVLDSRSLDNILDVISETLDAEYQIEQNTITLK